MSGNVSEPEATEQKLFDGDSAMFERVASSAQVYGEYGVGASTEWVYQNTLAKIVAVDTWPEWATYVMEGKDSNRVTIQSVDVGPVGDWGYPISYHRRANFADYAATIWRHAEKPDVVLVDGRFRVCCFLTSLITAAPGSHILFDDYCDRPRYHLVEEIVPLKETCGRQALFEVPARFDLEKALALIEQFRMVMD